MWECGNREGLICKPVTMTFFESCRSASRVYYFNENSIAAHYRMCDSQVQYYKSIDRRSKLCP